MDWYILKKVEALAAKQEEIVNVVNQLIVIVDNLSKQISSPAPEQANIKDD